MTKRFLLMMALLAAPFVTMAQSTSFETLWDEYRKETNCPTFTVNGSMLRAVSFFAEDEEEQDIMKELARTVDKMRVIRIPRGYNGVRDQDIDSFNKDLEGEAFEEWMTAHEDEYDVRVMAITDGEIVEQLVAVVTDHDQLIVMHMNGDINVKNIAYIIRAMDFDKM